MMGSNVFISDHNHGELSLSNIPVSKRPLTSKGPIVIGDNVFIGENVTILSGVTIGKGSIIGANAVVTHNAPPYSVVVGNPAIIIRHIELT